MKYWLLAEDFVACLVGPFDSIAAAAQHIAFCTERGDSSTFRILDDEGKRGLHVLGYGISPEKDREWTTPR
jgi:hypothetical protein